MGNEKSINIANSNGMKNISFFTSSSDTFNIKNINILELGVREGISTKKFLEVCEKNQGNLTSIDIDDCSKVSSDPRWKFIKGRDDDFTFIKSQMYHNLHSKSQVAIKVLLNI